jgi:histidinol-phosphate aminotransferase
MNYQNLITIILIIILLFILKFLFNKNFETFNQGNQHDELNEYYKDKVIIVTGSTSGIGKSIAKTFSKIDCKLVIHGRDQTKVDETIKLLNRSNIFGVIADLSDEEQYDSIIDKTIEKFGKIDILINNVTNRSGSKKLVKKKFADWKTEMNVNINSVFYLSKRAIETMKSKKNHGKIINISSNETKDRSTLGSSGTQILSKTFLERMSDLLADETNDDGISVAVIRIDSGNYASSKKDITDMKDGIVKKIYQNMNKVTDMLYDDPDTLTYLFLDIIKLPHHQLNGKVYSTSAYMENPKLSTIVPSYQLLINKNLYKDHKYTKQKTGDEVYLTKQNPYGVSENISKFIKDYDLSGSIQNVNTKSRDELETVLESELKINKKSIVIFKNDLEAFKKIINTFVTKYSNIFTLFPNNQYIEILSNELKLSLNFTTYISDKKQIQPNFAHIISNLDAKTKLVYLTSPNLLTGQSIDKDLFDKFMKDLPDNIIVVVHQSMLEFAKDNKNNLDPLKYLDQNVIVIRSFSNFYGYENLELSYVIASEDIAELLNQSNVYSQIDIFNEKLAIECINDKEHNKEIQDKIDKEKNRVYGILDKSNIDYYTSETNYILVRPNKDKEEIIKELEKRKIILEDDNLAFNDHWPIPLSTPDINDKLLDVLTRRF